ncbi:MAG: tetratricopeptide repeat protein [Bacteroidales bacterium]|nr:tetratricopeptide repeat protein [Bacteroidales bacterium]MBN2749556.1 tetratricopeptide repeat protein [Bacteroidales bacterium]
MSNHFQHKPIAFLLVAVACMLFVFSASHAQSQVKSDSLLCEGYINSTDSLLDLGEYYQALGTASLALSYAEKSGLLNGIALILTQKGYAYRSLGDNYKALEMLIVALENYQALNNEKGEASVLNQIGAVYRLQGSYPKALEYYLNSLRIYERLNIKSGIASTLNNIGIVYLYQKDYDRALDYYNRSLMLEQELNNQESISTSYINIGEAYKEKGQVDKALDYYLKALQIAKKYDDPDALGVLYNEIGSIYIDVGNSALARTYLYESLKIFEGIKSRNRLAEIHLNLGRHYLATQNQTNALKHLKTALDNASASKSNELLAKINLTLSQCYQQQSHYKQAYTHFQQHIAYRDSTYNKESTRKLVQAEMLHQFDKQQQEQKLLQDRKDSIANEVKRRQTLLRNFLLVAVLLLLTVVVVGYLALKQKQKANETLAQHQKLILEKNEELLQQQEEILAQRDEIEHKNQILEQSQKIIAAKNDRIISSIEYAQTIQEAILPKEELLKNIFADHFIVYLPKDIVSGDFYWFSSYNEKFFIAVIDCTGHGVPGSFMSMIGNTLLNQIVNEWQTHDPALILEYLHDKVRKALKQDENDKRAHMSMDIALLAYDSATQQATYAGARRPLYIVDCEGNFTRIPGDPRSVGGFQPEQKRYFTNHIVEANNGCSVYLTTDGYTDQMNPYMKKLGVKPFTDLLSKNYKHPLEGQKTALLNAYRAHKAGCEQIDDICILGIKFK